MGSRNEHDWIAQFRGDPEFEFHLAAARIGEEIVARLDDLGLTQAELATRMGVSAARVSQILRGADNLTLKSLVAVAAALDADLSLSMKPRGVTASPGRAKRAAGR